MLLFRVLWACKGAGGFIGQLREACRGVVGFKVAMWLRHVREKFALQAQNGRKTLFSGALGEIFRGNAAGRAAPGELFRGNAAGSPVLGDFCRGRPCRARCGLALSAPRASLSDTPLALWRSCSG